jgi:hypothetical protein
VAKTEGRHGGSDESELSHLSPPRKMSGGGPGQARPTGANAGGGFITGLLARSVGMQWMHPHLWP